MLEDVHLEEPFGRYIKALSANSAKSPVETHFKDITVGILNFLFITVICLIQRRYPSAVQYKLELH